MKNYTIISTIEDPKNIVSLLSEKGINRVKTGEDFIMYPAIVITNSENDSFPQLQVLSSIKPNPYTSDRVDSNWLSPFRNYKFQVSATIEGDFTMGDCPVVGLGNIIDAIYGTTKDTKAMPNGAYLHNIGFSEMHHTILTALATQALFSYVTKLDRGNPRRNHYDYTATKLMSGFIDIVVARLQSNRMVPGDPKFMEIIEEAGLFVTEVDDIEEFLKEQSAELVKLMPAEDETNS